MAMNFKQNAIVVLLLLGFGLPMLAQSDMDNRKFRLGLSASPNLSWIRPDIQGFSKDGLKSRAGFGYGVMVDYKFSDSPNYLLSTGFNITTNGGGLIEAWETEVVESDTSYTFLGTNDRTYRMQYVNIPILLKLRTTNILFCFVIAIDVGLKMRHKRRLKNHRGALTNLEEDDIDIADRMNFMRLAAF